MLSGAMISGASVISYVNSGRNMPLVANIAVSAISLAVFPGYILSAYLSNNIHDANLILAGIINLLLYSGLSLWLISRRSRKRSATKPGAGG